MCSCGQSSPNGRVITVDQSNPAAEAARQRVIEAAEAARHAAAALANANSGS